MQEIFETEKIAKAKQDFVYAEILETALKADAGTVKGRAQLREAIIKYINFASSRRNLNCTFSFWNEPKELSAEEKRFLMSTDGGMNLASTYKWQNHIEFSEFICQPESVGDFAYYVGVIEHELQHIEYIARPNNYSSKNTIGLTQEYSHHADAFTEIQDYLHENGTLAQQTLANMMTQIIYHFDDNEQHARWAALDAQKQFLKDIETLAKNINLTENFASAKNLINNLIDEQQSTTQMLAGVMREQQSAMQHLLYTLSGEAIQKKDFPLLEALAETQDVKQLYNPVIFERLRKTANRENWTTVSLRLDNSKYGEVPTAEIKKHISALLKADPSFPPHDALYNFTSAELAPLLPQGLSRPRTNLQSSERVITAEEIGGTTKLSREGTQHVSNQLKKETRAKSDARDIIAEEIGSTHPLGREEQNYVNKQFQKTASPRPEAEPKIITAREIGIEGELDKASQSHIKKLASKTARTIQNTKDIIVAKEILPKTKKARAPQAPVAPKRPESKTKSGVIIAKETALSRRIQEDVITARETPLSGPMKKDEQVYISKQQNRAPKPTDHQSDFIL